MKKSIIGTENCFGCGLCAVICRKDAIKIELNKNGFYEPNVNADVCVKCGLCSTICPFDKGLEAFSKEPFSFFAGWSKNPENRINTSSGGVAYETALYLLNNGYKVCGVRFNPKFNRAEHYISSSEKELAESMGSKYIQSYTVDAFKNVKLNEKYFVVGSPCQIHAFRNYIRYFHREENFVLMDFFCHGVPSKMIWDKYSREISSRIGPIKHASWRNKKTGWHDSWVMTLYGNDDIYERRLSQGDLFFKFFLCDACLGKQCYSKCRYKGVRSFADIRIGDLWGEGYKHDEKGVNGVIAFTPVGKQALHGANVFLKKETEDVVLAGQMKNKITKPWMYELVMKLLRTRFSLRKVYLIMQLLRIKDIVKRRLF